MKIITPTIILVILVYPSFSCGQIASNLTLGNPKALALASAVTADPPGIDSVHFNPAGLAKINSKIYQIKVLAADLSSTTRFGGQADRVKEQLATFPATQKRNAGLFDDPIIGETSKTNGPALMLPFVGLKKLPALVVPMGGFAINHDYANFTFANAFYSPGGVGYGRNEDDPGRYDGQEVSLVRITYLSPSIGFKVNDQFFIGGSIGVSWQGIGMDLEMRAPTFPLYGLAQSADAILPEKNCLNAEQFLVEGLCGAIGPFDDLLHLNVQLSNALAPSINLGILWEPTDYLVLGAVYQSSSKSELSGSYEVEYSAKWQTFFGNLAPITRPIGLAVGKAAEKGAATFKYTEPQRFSAGTSIRLIPTLKLNIDAKWSDFEAWDSFDVQLDQKLDFLKLATYLQPANAAPDSFKLPRGYRSVWSWAFGVEYEYTDKLALRAGFEPRKSAIPADKTDALLPIYDANLYSVGLAFQLSEHQLLECAGGYLNSKYNILNREGKTSSNFNMYEDNVRNVIYNPYMGLSAKIETKAYLFSLAYTNSF